MNKQKAESELKVQRTNWWVPEGRAAGGLGKMGEGAREIKAPGYGMNKSQE